MLELKKKATDKFREIDGNGSGYLANDELDKLVTFVNGVCFDFFNARKALLDKYDKDKDGKINLDEFLCIMDDIAHADSDVVQTSIGPRFVSCFLLVCCLYVCCLLVCVFVFVCLCMFVCSFFHLLSQTYPLITPCQLTLSAHPINPPSTPAFPFPVHSNNATVRKVKTHRSSSMEATPSSSSSPRGLNPSDLSPTVTTRLQQQLLQQ